MVLMVKALIVSLLLFIVVNLAWAGIAMVRQSKDDGSNHPMSRHLGRRVGFSLLLLLILIIAMASGYLPMNPRPY